MKYKIRLLDSEGKKLHERTVSATDFRTTTALIVWNEQSFIYQRLMLSELTLEYVEVIPKYLSKE